MVASQGGLLRRFTFNVVPPEWSLFGWLCREVRRSPSLRNRTHGVYSKGLPLHVSIADMRKNIRQNPSSTSQYVGSFVHGIRIPLLSTCKHPQFLCVTGQTGDAPKGLASKLVCYQHVVIPGYLGDLTLRIFQCDGVLLRALSRGFSRQGQYHRQVSECWTTKQSQKQSKGSETSWSYW